MSRVKTVRRYQQPSVVYMCPVTSTFASVERWRSEEALPGKGSLAPCQSEASSPQPGNDSVSSVSTQLVRVPLKKRESDRPGDSFLR